MKREFDACDVFVYDLPTKNKVCFDEFNRVCGLLCVTAHWCDA